MDKLQKGKINFMKNKISAFVHSNRGICFLWAVLTLYGGIGVCYLFNIAGFAGQVDLKGFTQSALNPLSFVLVGYFLRLLYRDYQKIEDKKKRKRRFLFSYVFSFLLALSFVLGYQMRTIGNTLPGFKGKGEILIMAGGLAFAFLPLVNKWFVLLEKWQSGGEKEDLSACAKRKTFPISWLVIFLCWIPVFLAYYPAIMSYDFHRQSQEAYQGFIWFNDHHPLVHTFLIRVFFLLGEAIGSYQVGMALFSLLQMLILSAVLAYSCNVIARMTRRIWPAVVMAVIYAILPIHPVMALSMTKDVLFSAFFLLLLLLIWEQRRFFTEVYAGSKRDKLKMLGFAAAMLLTGILTMLLRNNAVYAFAIFAVIYVLFSAKQRIYIALLCVAIVAGGMGCKTGIREAMNAGTGSQAEMYSVFMQQFARVGQKQAATLTDEEWEIIKYYVGDEWDDYNPPLADTIKGTITVTTFQTWKDDIPKMLSDWVKIGVRYFNEYIDAFLALTSGYWFLDDVSHAEVLSYGEDTNLGLLYTFNASVSDAFAGVESKSYFPALLSAYQKIVNGNSYYGWPLLSVLFKPAFYSWILVLAFISYAYLKEYRKQLLSYFVLLYLMTLLLGPVVNLRYAYPIMIAVPVFVALIFSKEHKKTIEKV